jgi:putative oxidoreductase
MSAFESRLATCAPPAHALLRIVTAFLFFQAGTSKLFGVPHVAMFDELQLVSLRGAAGILEVIGGSLILIGLYTRPTAFVLSGLMAFAYFIGHASIKTFFSPILNDGTPAILFCFIFLFLAAAGAGPWSVDATRRAG